VHKARDHGIHNFIDVTANIEVKKAQKLDEN